MKDTSETFMNPGVNHRRVIRSTLIRLDQDLLRIEQLARGLEIRSELYELRNSLTPEAQEKLIEEVAVIRKMLAELSEAFGFEKRIEDAAHIIATSCSCMWENIRELKSRHLKKYGKLPPGFKSSFDPRIEVLTGRIHGISELVKM